MITTSLKNKIWLCLAAGLVTGATFRRLSFKYCLPWFPVPVLLAISVLLLLAGLILPYVWQAGEKKSSINGEKLKANLEHLLIYALALDLTMFGFHKIEGLQMIVPLGMLDTPFSSFSGENLVWAFFRYSYSFTVLIALLQMVTACTLLFSKTRLFGLLLALPILIFICCLDFFYQMPIGVLLHGLALLVGVFYLLSQDFSRLIDFIFRSMPGLAVFRGAHYTKIFARLSLLIWPILFHFIYSYPDKHPDLTGKYQVKNLVINNHKKEVGSTRDSVLTKIYLDLDNEIVFDFNDYRNRYIGNYVYNQRTDSISIHWRYPSDTISPFEGKLLKVKNTLTLSGKIKNESMKMDLLKY